MTAGELTKIIKDKALKFGFSDCGISKADFLEEEAPRLENYLKKKLPRRDDLFRKSF